MSADLNQLTVKTLKDIARRNDVSGYSKFNKAGLIEYLRENIDKKKL
jgi:hypothetical protein